MKLDRVLVATDLSQHSLAITRSALAMVRALGAKVLLVHAVSPPIDVSRAQDAVAPWIDQAIDAARLRLGELAEAGDEVDVVVGVAGSAIIDRAEKGSADLIIVGGRPADDPLRLLVGSTSLEVVRALRRPVLVLREPLTKSTFSAPLVAVDLSAASGSAIQWTRAVARDLASLELLHVLEVGSDLPTALAAVAGELRSEAESQIATLASELSDLDVFYSVVSQHERAELGRVADQIVEAARARDLIVIGAGKPDNQTLGSVADRIIRCATGPVLVVPAS